ncbi:ATP-dependent DNA helicase, partial [Corynebacterium pseudodiphtheriticum]
LLRRMERGEVRLISRDLPAPSPMAAEILSARPYTFLDDAPLEERRTQAVLNRRWSDPQSTDDLGALDADAIAGVREEAWPAPNGPDEMHEALMSLACIAAREITPQWAAWLQALAQAGRAYPLPNGLWVAVERLSCLQSIYPGNWPLLPGFDEPWSYDEAVVEVLRARLGGFGPLSLSEIAAPLELPVSDVTQALARLEQEGYVLRGRFSPGANAEQWCERHLLARIHRYTVKRLRREIEPVALQDFMRFLFDWQHLSTATRGQGSAMLAQ